jgi:two-component system, NarL family, response regulator DevR
VASKPVRPRSAACEACRVLGSTRQPLSKPGAPSKRVLALTAAEAPGHPWTRSGAPALDLTLADIRALLYNGSMDTYVRRLHRVYLVDDHDIVRRGLRDLLVNAGDIDVVGDSGSAREAVSEILRLDADVMVLDLQLQDGSGIEVCRAVRSVNPSASGLLFTAADDDVALLGAVLAGAAGYLVKLGRNLDIVGTIRRIRAGRSLMDADRVLEARQALEWLVGSLSPAVTERERQILQAVIDGQTNRQITDLLGSEPDKIDSEIEGLVARVTKALLGGGTPSDEPGVGRHRLADE